MVDINKRKEYECRLVRIKKAMVEKEVDLLVVFGDEYRKENLRYACGFWPIFERGSVLIPLEGEPIVIAAAEGEAIAKEMSVWSDIRIVPEFECVTVADKIEYPYAKYTSFRDIKKELHERGRLKKVGLIGVDAMPKDIYDTIKNSFKEFEVVDANSIFQKLRIVKSEYEIECFRKAQSIADAGFKAIIKACVPGITETQAAAAGEFAARDAGAEAIIFCIMASGERTNTVVGRASNKVIEDGDMIMAGLAIQYEGYIATTGFPFVVGKPDEKQIELIDALVAASDIAVSELKAGKRQGDFVRPIKEYFKKIGLERYDLYPPLHGAGLSEAELPYPNEKTDAPFFENTIANTDISLFGHPAGSNRVEEGLLITKNGAERLSAVVPKLVKDWKEIKGIRLQSVL